MTVESERIARLEMRVSTVETDLREILQEIGGVTHGSGKTLRRRVHDMETNAAAAKAATAALAAAEAMRKEGFSARQKLIVTLGAAIAGLAALPQLIEKLNDLL